jgi:dimethylargininase
VLTAITRQVSPAINQCELTHFERQPIDFEIAQDQHEKYEGGLRSLGIKVISLPAEAALITNPGAGSRLAEIASIATALSAFRKLAVIQAPATLDGGDVLVIGKTIFVGCSSRSNPLALVQMQNLLSPYGYRVKGVEISSCLHLKSAVTRVAEKTLLINPDWVDKKLFPGMDFIEIDPSEPYSANALLIEESVIFPTAFPKTCGRLTAAGIAVIPVDVSELAKAESGLTCCSLIFNS